MHAQSDTCTDSHSSPAAGRGNRGEHWAKDSTGKGHGVLTLWMQVLQYYQPQELKIVNEIYFVVAVFNFKQNRLFGSTKARNLYFVLLKRNIRFSLSNVSKSQSDKESQIR